MILLMDGWMKMVVSRDFCCQVVYIYAVGVLLPI